MRMLLARSATTLLSVTLVYLALAPFVRGASHLAA